MPQWQRNLYTLWAAQFLAMVGLSLVVPFMPLYIGTLGVAPLAAVERWSGTLFAAPFLMQTIAAPLWGVLGDRYGRKLMVIRALGGIGFTNILAALVLNVWQLLVLRAVQGGVSGFVAATNALVSAAMPRDRLGAAMGLLQTSMTAGSVVGPLIGGALADLVGYRYVFLVNGFLCWVGAAVVLRGVREAPVAEQAIARPGVRENLAYFLASPALRTTGLFLCASQMAVMVIEPIFPVYVQTLGVPTAHVATVAGFLFSVTGIAAIFGAPVWGRASDRYGEARVLVIVLWGACFAYALQAGVHSVYTLFVFRALLGFFVAGVLPPLYAIVARFTPAERLGAIMGVTSSTIMVGNLIGPIVGGVGAAAFGIRPIFGMASAILAVCAVGVGGLARARQEPDASRHIVSSEGGDR